MDLNYPEELLDQVQWEQHVCEQLPLLDHAWREGNMDKFRTLLALYGLSFEKYENEWYSGEIYAPYIPIMRRAIPKMISDEIASVQPMSEPTSKILQLRIRNSQEKH